MADRSTKDLYDYLLQDDKKPTVAPTTTPTAVPTPAPTSASPDITGAKQTEEQLMIALGLIKPKK